MLTYRANLLVLLAATFTHAEGAGYIWELKENHNCGECGKLNIGPHNNQYQSMGPVSMTKTVHDGYMPVQGDAYIDPGKVILGGDQTDIWESGDIFVIREDDGSAVDLAGPKNVTSTELKKFAYGTQTWVFFEGTKDLPWLKGKWIFRKNEDQGSSTTTTTTMVDVADEEDATGPPATCAATCDNNKKCAGFMFLKNEKRCYFRSTTDCNRNQDNNRDCWTKVKDPDADGIDPNMAKTSCQKGVCAGQDFFFFSNTYSAEQCAGVCLKEKLKGHDCQYYTFSNVTKYCLLYSDCPTVDTSSLKAPEEMFLKPGDLASYSSCKFTTYTIEKWVDMKTTTSATRLISTAHGGSAKRAIDGNMASHWGGGSCTHTHRHQNPWWEVDFKKETRIDAVRVLNRGDCCEQRLGDFNVKVDGIRCGEGGAGKGELKEVACGVTGKTLRIESNRNEWYTLCEVQVKQLEIEDISNETWLL